MKYVIVVDIPNEDDPGDSIDTVASDIAYHARQFIKVFGVHKHYRNATFLPLKGTLP